ncbi:MAG: hypothetical protein KAS69_04020 [Planctomycetes bacterium]|nr:hypothetical protein [Planctomycetota bacterium]
MRKLSIVLFFLLLANSVAFSAESKSAANLLQEGLYAEEIEVESKPGKGSEFIVKLSGY